MALASGTIDSTLCVEDASSSGNRRRDANAFAKAVAMSALVSARSG
jgi:hypothetical protein